MRLMDDLDIVACSIRADHPSYMRLRAFIEANEPWLPPRQSGFSPWIEYRQGAKGPCINDVVHVLTRTERKNKFFRPSKHIAQGICWDYVVAYCVKEDTP